MKALEVNAVADRLFALASTGARTPYEDEVWKLLESHTVSDQALLVREMVHRVGKKGTGPVKIAYGRLVPALGVLQVINLSWAFLAILDTATADLVTLGGGIGRRRILLGLSHFIYEHYLMDPRGR